VGNRGGDARTTRVITRGKETQRVVRAQPCARSHPKRLPQLNRDWSASSIWCSDARSGGGGALLAGSLSCLRIANSKPQPPDLASRCSRSGPNDVLKPPSWRRRDWMVPSRPRRGHLQPSRLAVRVVDHAFHRLRSINSSEGRYFDCSASFPRNLPASKVDECAGTHHAPSNCIKSCVSIDCAAGRVALADIPVHG